MSLLEYENKFRSEGYKNIVGIDEVGRGPLAGPLVVSAVILPVNFNNEEINDSKKLSDSKRRELYEIIKKEALEIKTLVIDNKEVDKLNIYQATKKAMQDIVRLMDLEVDAIFVDAMKLDGMNKPVLSLIKGDAKSISIASASIVAKVIRDDMMIEYDKMYPGYDFKNNKGYGTKKHMDAILKRGITPIHRLSYKPVSMYNNLRFDI